MLRIVTLAAGLVCAATAYAQDTPPMAMPTTAPEFVTAAGQSDQFEIQEGKTAEKMGSPVVRRFGAKMVRDHLKTTATLMQAVKKAGMTPPPPPPLRPDQEQMMTQLQGLSGADFDKAYLAQQVHSHKEALALQTGYAEGGDTPAIKTAAKGTIPIVRMHLSMAEKMAHM